jgi:hypothetical protein
VKRRIRSARFRRWVQCAVLPGVILLGVMSGGCSISSTLVSSLESVGVTLLESALESMLTSTTTTSSSS